MIGHVIGGILSSSLILVGLALPAEDGAKRIPDKTIEIKGDAAGFVLKGQKKATDVTVIVGQTVRWQNQNESTHSATSDLQYEGRPLFDTGLLKPGKQKDILFDINLYRKAGGKTAGVVTLTYHSAKNPKMKGTILLLSAAKRGGFNR